MNICMRQLTLLQCDPCWAIFGRESVTAILVGGWLAYQVLRGRAALPSGRALILLLLVALLVEAVGNVCNQWALGIVGLAVTIPTIFGTMITSGAIIGRFWLGESVSLRSVAAIGVLLLALVLLGLAAKAATDAAGSRATTASVLVMAVVVAGLAGTIFALLTATIRHAVTGTVAPGVVAFLVPLMGVVSLGPISVARLGLPVLTHTSAEQFLVMAAAGVFNLIGFLAIIFGLQRTTVVYANVVNASQVAMAALAGVLLFHEAPNLWLVLGVGLTILGIVGIDRPPEAMEEVLPP